METAGRSLAKTISYRILSFFFVWLIAMLAGCTVEVGCEIAVLDLAAKVAFYYAHERVWARINGWGA